MFYFRSNREINALVQLFPRRLYSHPKKYNTSSYQLVVKDVWYVVRDDNNTVRERGKSKRLYIYKKGFIF